jgi:glucose-1-phosphate thymidylyltransferase
LYFYDGRASQFASGLKPSPRGELEITDLNRCYLEEGALQLEKLGRGFAWLDTGTHESLVEASSYIETIEKRQGLRVCCPEEIAYLNGWIDAAQLEALARPLAKNGYGQYLLSLLEHGPVA